MDTVRELAQRNRTVLAVIHQPSSEVGFKGDYLMPKIACFCMLPAKVLCNGHFSNLGSGSTSQGPN
eukprot:708325-Pelagomonas_calceolata.AAC.1